MDVFCLILLFPIVMMVNLDDFEYLEIDTSYGNIFSSIIQYHVMSLLCQGVSPPVNGSEEVTSPIVVETDREMTVTLPGVGK